MSEKDDTEGDTDEDDRPARGTYTEIVFVGGRSDPPKYIDVKIGQETRTVEVEPVDTLIARCNAELLAMATELPAEAELCVAGEVTVTGSAPRKAELSVVLTGKETGAVAGTCLRCRRRTPLFEGYSRRTCPYCGGLVVDATEPCEPCEPLHDLGPLPKARTVPHRPELEGGPMTRERRAYIRQKLEAYGADCFDERDLLDALDALDARDEARANGTGCAWCGDRDVIPCERCKRLMCGDHCAIADSSGKIGILLCHECAAKETAKEAAGTG